MFAFRVHPEKNTPLDTDSEDDIVIGKNAGKCIVDADTVVLNMAPDNIIVEEVIVSKMESDHNPYISLQSGLPSHLINTSNNESTHTYVDENEQPRYALSSSREQITSDSESTHSYVKKNEEPKGVLSSTSQQQNTTDSQSNQSYVDKNTKQRFVVSDLRGRIGKHPRSAARPSLNEPPLPGRRDERRRGKGGSVRDDGEFRDDDDDDFEEGDAVTVTVNSFPRFSIVNSKVKITRPMPKPKRQIRKKSESRLDMLRDIYDPLGVIGHVHKPVHPDDVDTGRPVYGRPIHLGDTSMMPRPVFSGDKIKVKEWSTILD